jgi:hypothetical protein
LALYLSWFVPNSTLGCSRIFTQSHLRDAYNAVTVYCYQIHITDFWCFLHCENTRTTQSGIRYESRKVQGQRQYGWKKKMQ